jgi:TonB family protein
MLRRSSVKKGISRKTAVFVSVFLLSTVVVSRGIAQPGPKICIHMFLFQGVRDDGQPGMKEAEAFLVSSRSELASIKPLINGAESALAAAAIEALFGAFKPAALDELFYHEAAWDKKKPADDWVIGSASSYRISVAARPAEADRFGIHLAIAASGTRPVYEMIKASTVFIEKDFEFARDEPILAVIPNPQGDFYLIIWAAAGEPAVRTKPGPPKETIFYVQPPQVREQVQPSFPEELRRRNIRGRIGLLIKIDEKGNVRRVSVEKPLHAYLNFAAVQAFLKWTFEPVSIKGKTVKAAFRYGYDYNPWLTLQEETWPGMSPGGSSSDRGDLGRVLDQTAEYCKRLAAAASDYVCEESIQETHYDPLNNRQWEVLSVVSTDKREKENNPDRQWKEPEFIDKINSGLIADDHKVVGRVLLEQWFQHVDPRRDKRNTYLCDYQIFRKDKIVHEHRTILKENGKKPADSKKLLQDRRYSALGAFFAPLLVLAKDRQPKFDFMLAGEEKIHGQKARILTATPKSGDEDGIWWARLWVDKESFQVLKCEIEGIPIDGQEDILNECAYLNIRPHFLMTYEYKPEKNGALFPWRSEILVAYSGIDAGGPVPRLKIFMNYDKYKFFSVATESRVIR